MSRSFYSAKVSDFLGRSVEEILGLLNRVSRMSIEFTQQQAWLKQIELLHEVLPTFSNRGSIFFEYSVPRLGKRIDVVLVLDHVVFILEFKVGERSFSASAIDQVWDYGLDLKNFHHSSHDLPIVPVLVATEARELPFVITQSPRNDGVSKPVCVSGSQVKAVLEHALIALPGTLIDPEIWDKGRYKPTPTIVEAAAALYNGHSVEDISKNDAGAKNLSKTSGAVLNIVQAARTRSRKAICFVTGVPGAGKTLVGLDVATTALTESGNAEAVYLSGNGPLVAVLREALAMDRIAHEAERGKKVKKSDARRAVTTFIQNVHHFRDAYLNDTHAPNDHVAIFDEAQRAWGHEQATRFMQNKRGLAGFSKSEPEFLISCLDRHKDWAVVVCLVGGGQEINTGEAGIAEWIDSLLHSFPNWDIHISPELSDAEYGAGEILKKLTNRSGVYPDMDLHLSMAMRSFRAENLSGLVKSLLDLELKQAQSHLKQINGQYPIVLTRSVDKAKRWIREQARGTERFGMIVSSQAQRLRPHAIDVRAPVDPVNWFLKGKDDVRSSYYLEDVATEFHVQGLELDWSCVVWDGDFRYSPSGWQHASFKGNRWEKINKVERQTYLKNAYRVLLTRARQGMVIVVPEGNAEDATRLPAYYDSTFQYLASAGLQQI